jgi:predicted phosphoribosyltransferase
MSHSIFRPPANEETSVLRLLADQAFSRTAGAPLVPGNEINEVRGRTVILIDDGIATGSSILAAIHALRQMQPAGIVVGTPVGPPDTVIRLQREVNELVCVEMPESFYGVGQ